MNLIDANILIRFLARDDEEKAERCKSLLEAVVKGKSPRLFVCDLAVAEIIWVLESFYGLSKAEVQRKIEGILNTSNLEFQNKSIISESVIIYATHNIDFIDAYQATLAKQAQITNIYSYDTDFDKLADIKRLEP